MNKSAFVRMGIKDDGIHLNFHPIILICFCQDRHTEHADRRDEMSFSQ